MGRSWIGFQPPVKRPTGQRVVVSASFPVALPDSQVVALLTTAEGLSQWLATVVTFSGRRGGNLDFRDEQGDFGGSYSDLDIPRRVTLITERHGEVAVVLDLRTARSLTVTVTRLAEGPGSEDSVRATAHHLIEALRERCSHGD